MSADNSGTNSENWEEERAELLNQSDDSITAALESGNMLARIKSLVYSLEPSYDVDVYRECYNQIRSILDESGTEVSPSDDHS